MRVQGILFAVLLCICAVRSQPGAGSSAVEKDGVIYVSGGVKLAPLCASCPTNYETVSTSMQGFSLAVQEGPSVEYGPESSFTQARAYHTSVVYNNTIVLFGGAGKSNLLEQYDITTQQWSAITPYDDGYSWTPLGQKPSGRYGHGAVVVEDYMYVFGGFDAVSGNALNDLWLFDFKTKTWATYEVRGWSPQARGGFSFVNAKVNDTDVILLFGGLDSSTPANYFNDLWVFNTDTFTWRHSSLHDSPAARAFHSAVVFGGNHLMIFGGSSPDTEVYGKLVYHDDVWRVNVNLSQSIRSWHQISFPDVNAEYPLARDSAAVAAYDRDGVYQIALFFGSSDATRETLADIWTITLVPSQAALEASEGTPTNAPDFGFGSGNINITEASEIKFKDLVGTWTLYGAYSGYIVPGGFDCSTVGSCSGNGQCQSTGVCCCDTNWEGEYCNVSTCDSYRGFDSHELNAILLPDIIQTTIAKLQALSAKLSQIQQVRDLLPSVNASMVNMGAFASASYTFAESNLAADLVLSTSCFADIVGCDEPCGSETSCVVGDTCTDNECIGGTPLDCAGQLNVTNNMCLNAWCDESKGCQISSVVCDDENSCTDESCDPATGLCVSTPKNCDDGDCCTMDWCENGTCHHASKCEDYNPCTVDSCSASCAFGSCSYTFQDACYLSVGQNANSEPDELYTSRSNGAPIEFTGAKVVPPQPNTLSAQGYFFLLAADCELRYQITYEEEVGVIETGAFLYGNAGVNENAGVVASLPLGSEKIGSWSFCDYGVPVSALLNGEIYAEIYFNTGSIRAQVEFQTSS